MKLQDLQKQALQLPISGLAKRGTARSLAFSSVPAKFNSTRNAVVHFFKSNGQTLNRSRSLDSKFNRCN
jgi:hypothetical protein